MVADCPWIDIARAELVGRFLDGKETELLFIDSDIWFDPKIVATMRAAESDVITCTYRKRSPPHQFVAALHGKKHPKEVECRRVDGCHVIEIERDGLGCCLIQRRVIEKMCTPDLSYTSETGQQGWNLFEYGLIEEDGVRRLGHEDKAFFQRVRAAGFKVECLMDAVIVHGGVPGRFLDVLAKPG